MADNSTVADLLVRGADFEVFCEDILGVKLNPAQKRVARALRLGVARQWCFKELVVVAANQVGKSLIQACIILWGCLYKIGVDPRDVKLWTNEPYLWIHLGPVQQQAYHVYKDMKMLAKGEHPSQGNRCKLPKGLVNEIKIENYYDGFGFYNGATAMFRTGEQKASAVLGYRAAAISVDEAAFLDHLTEVKNTVLMMRLIASGGPLFLFSTPNGMNDFYDQADPIKAKGEEVEDSVWRFEDNILVWATIADNIGYGIDEIEARRMERDLNPATKEQQLRGAFLEPLEAFFVPQKSILSVFRNDLPTEQLPIPGHQYVEYWDPSISSDPTAVIVLDITSLPWTGVYHGYWDKPLDVTQLVGEMMRIHGMYDGHKDANFLSMPSRSVMGHDGTSMGGAVIRQLLAPVRNKRSVDMAGAPAKKVKALTNLRNRLTRGEIILPASWTGVRSELLNYKLKDDKIKQDRVMALMGADIVASIVAASRPQIPINPSSQVVQRRELRWR